MKSTFKVLFFLKRDKQKTNGTIPLFCRITVDQKEARFGMKTDINPAHWDVNAGKATGRAKEVPEINSLINSTRSALYRIYRNMQERDSNVTAEKIKNEFLGVAETRHNLLELFQRHNEDVKKLIGIDKSKATYQKYEVTRTRLTDFIKERYNLSDIALKKIKQVK